MSKAFVTDLHSFIDHILEPVECLSRLFTNGQDEADWQPYHEAHDIGVVTAAMASLAKMQLTSLIERLETTYGEPR